ncbi:MAG: carboxylating nicotinate-nucleotide diphosphorylase [Endomicrobiia bacterium]|jgi:nicotinate-nucleotide pyrophosphorylase (carboxylating)|nr:carboxylating nicotinate-nucleotide diphosphorylase [Endomicrobiaceae bacterium]MDD3922971.1 carboxylating nicotinate-nucleotide diphosphorylase [Endomicrobiaceae bacterium]
MNMDKVISLALEEDCAYDDVTSKNIITKDIKATAVLVAKDNGVLCGLEIFKKVFLKLNKDFKFKVFIKDAQTVKKGDVILTMQGSASSLLSGERTALNFIQKLSGIATTTNVFVNVIKGSKTKIYDTRKTIPGFRNISKYAVRCGGAQNHRMNLSDMVLIKDNHLALIDDLSLKVKEIRKKHKKLLIQIECENQKNVQDAIEAKADFIMLDNMGKDLLKKMIKLIRKSSTKSYKPAIEISGGIDFKTIKEYAKLGIERISIGMLTHSAPSLDMSLEVKVQK